MSLFFSVLLCALCFLGAPSDCRGSDNPVLCAEMLRPFLARSSNPQDVLNQLYSSKWHTRKNAADMLRNALYKHKISWRTNQKELEEIVFILDFILESYQWLDEHAPEGEPLSCVSSYSFSIRDLKEKVILVALENALTKGAAPRPMDRSSSGDSDASMAAISSSFGEVCGATPPPPLII